MRGFLACALLLLAPRPARAASPDGLGPQPGLSLGGRAAYFHADAPAVFTRSWYGGAQARWAFSQRWAAELSLDYDRQDYGFVHSDVFPLMASALLYLTPQRRVSPFLLAGGGWYLTRTTGAGEYYNTSNRFGVHAGLGIEVWLSRSWSIDGTWRYLWIGSIPTASHPIGGDGWLGTAGLSYHYTARF